MTDTRNKRGIIALGGAIILGIGLGLVGARFWAVSVVLALSTLYWVPFIMLEPDERKRFWKAVRKEGTRYLRKEK